MSSITSLLQHIFLAEEAIKQGYALEVFFKKGDYAGFPDYYLFKIGGSDKYKWRFVWNYASSILESCDTFEDYHDGTSWITNIYELNDPFDRNRALALERSCRVNTLESMWYYIDDSISITRREDTYWDAINESTAYFGNRQKLIDYFDPAINTGLHSDFDVVDSNDIEDPKRKISTIIREDYLDTLY